jgi:hypothetical protein
MLVLAGLAGCKGDPTGDLRNGVDHLIATPSAIFLAPGASTNVTVEALDEQGNRQGTRFTLDAISPLISVVEDSSFNRIVDNDGNLVFPKNPTRLRYAVTPVATVGDASFTVRASGKEILIPVRLVPDSVAVTFSNAAPATGDTVTVTTAAPFQFRPNATVVAGGSPGVVVSQSASSIQFVPMPGGTGVAQVTGVALNYATTLALALPTTAEFTVPAGFTGTGAIATAPSVTLPAAGSGTLFVDAGATAAVPQCTNSLLGSPCRVYQLTLAAGRTFAIRANWEGESDLGVYFLNSAGTLSLGLGACDDKLDGAAGQPESCTITLGAGTFYLVVVNFSAADPVWIRLNLTGQ